MTRRPASGSSARPLDEPLRWIAENGGVNGYVVTAKVRELGVGSGYNAATEEYGDLVAQGVLDPVKVTRSALVNASSIAGMLLTTETLVVDKPEDEEPDGGRSRPRARPLSHSSPALTHDPPVTVTGGSASFHGPELNSKPAPWQSGSGVARSTPRSSQIGRSPQAVPART